MQAWPHRQRQGLAPAAAAWHQGTHLRRRLGGPSRSCGADGRRFTNFGRGGAPHGGRTATRHVLGRHGLPTSAITSDPAWATHRFGCHVAPLAPGGPGRGAPLLRRRSTSRLPPLLPPRASVHSKTEVGSFSRREHIRLIIQPRAATLQPRCRGVSWVGARGAGSNAGTAQTRPQLAAEWIGCGPGCAANRVQSPAAPEPSQRDRRCAARYQLQPCTTPRAQSDARPHWPRHRTTDHDSSLPNQAVSAGNTCL